MSQIDVAYSVDVNMSSAPRGLTTRIVANVGLFSNEEANFSDEYRVYSSPAAVAQDFGTDSVTYAMANAMYSQSPNLTSGRGSLYVIPYIATNATSGYVETGDISQNIENFKTVTNGEITITIDGDEVQLKKLNFRGVKTLQDIVNVLLAKQPDVYITVVENKIRFESKSYGTTSTIALGNEGIGLGTDLTGLNYFNTGALSPRAGVAAIDQEKLSEAVNRVMNKVYFGQILDTCYRDNKSIKDNATELASTDKNYFEVSESLINAVDKLGKDLIEGGFKRTKLMGYGNGRKEAKAMLAAAVSRGLATNYAGSDTCLTLNLKELATIAPDANLNLTIVEKAKANGVDIYANQGGLGVYFSNKGAGGYFDDMTGSQAFQNDLQVAAYNYIRQVGTKVAQTEEGLTGLKNVIAKVCRQYVVNGFLGIGLTWNGAEKFGNVEDFDRNIFEQGFYIYSLPIAEQAQAEREGRIAPLIQLAGKSAGAVHFATIIGILES